MSDQTLGFVFPGQGSQSTGMLVELASNNENVARTFEEASNSLGFDLLELIRDNPAEALNKTENTQPAILTCSVALWRLWQEMTGDLPVYLAGHSLGEYSALVCADVLSLTDAVVLVTDRGRFMQEAVPEGVGAMAAIVGLEREEVQQLCVEAEQSQIVSAANFNSPNQIVIAGHREAVERACSLAKNAGAKRAILLPISVPSHCSLMSDAAERFALRLGQITFSQANIPVVQNVDAKLRSNPNEIKQSLLQQLHQPVRWVETIEYLGAKGVGRIIECGPGKVLTGLIKRIDRSLKVHAVFDKDSLDAALNGGAI
jgi:[acyl-carrier-protein] S-malonyltransferase